MKQFDPVFFTKPSGDTKRPRRLHKGGGGDGGAADRAAAESKRVQEAIARINQIFGVGQATAPEAVDRNAFVKAAPSAGVVIPSMSQGTSILKSATSPATSTFDDAGYQAALQAAQAKFEATKAAGAAREQLYSKIGSDATNTALVDLNKDRATTERDLGFMLARAGLSGGSRDVDVNKDVLDTYGQGVLKASNLGTSVANGARLADATTKSNLISAITAGLDSGSAQQQALEGQSNNARKAQDEANATSLSGFFDALKQQQANAAYIQGQNGVLQPTAIKKTAGINSNYDGSTASYA